MTTRSEKVSMVTQKPSTNAMHMTTRGVTYEPFPPRDMKELTLYSSGLVFLTANSGRR